MEVRAEISELDNQPLSGEECEEAKYQLGLEVARVVVPRIANRHSGVEKLTRDPQEFVDITAFGRRRFKRLRISNGGKSPESLIVESFAGIPDRLRKKRRGSIWSPKEIALLVQCRELMEKGISFDDAVDEVRSHFGAGVSEKSRA